MNCDDIRDLMPLFVGGEAEDNERIAVEAHVSVCSECAAELEEFRRARAALVDLRSEEPPLEVVEGVGRNLHPRPLLGADWFVRAAAVLVVGIAIGFLGVTLVRKDADSGAGGVPAVRRSAALVSPGPGSRSRFAGSGQEWNDVFEERETRRFPVPRADRPEGQHYLPRAETVTITGERDF